MPESEKPGSSQPYNIFETQQFQNDLARLGPSVQRRIEAKLRHFVYTMLRENPQLGPNIKRLRNWEPTTCRWQVGDWRFFYEIDLRQRIVLMTVADHRKEVYR